MSVQNITNALKYLCQRLREDLIIRPPETQETAVQPKWQKSHITHQKRKKTKLMYDCRYSEHYFYSFIVTVLILTDGLYDESRAKKVKLLLAVYPRSVTNCWMAHDRG